MEEKKSSILKGKKGLIVGIANERSLAWGIANCIHQHGGELALTYQNDALKKRIVPLATKVNSNNIYVIDSGNVVDSGKHEDLIKKSELYRSFYEKQIQK